MTRKKPDARPSILSICTIILSSTLLLVVLALAFSVHVDQQFTYLADGFIHGQLGYRSVPSTSLSDIVYWHGAAYWALPPLPGILLVPFVGLFSIFNTVFYQGYLQVCMVLALLYILVRLAQKLQYSLSDSLILAFGFILGSVFVGVAAYSSSWYFAQVVTTVLLFTAFLEYFGRKRWWLIGIICALIALTRMSAALIVVFFILEICWHQPLITRQKIKTLGTLLAPMLVAGVVFALYNYTRFHSILQMGYSFQTLPNKSVARAREYGLFSPIHIPSNAYYALLSPPLPVFRDATSHVLRFPFIQNNPWGISTFVTSPYLLRLFTLPRTVFDARVKRLFITLGITMLAVFMFYGIGYVQFGYRYALDFLPCAYVIFMVTYKKTHSTLSEPMKFLFLSGIILNFILLLTFV